MQNTLRNIAKNLYRKLIPRKPLPDSLINIYISKSALLNNINEFKKINNKRDITPMLKSNAYGHGIVQIAQILEKESLKFMSVDSFFEARLLRENGIKTPLLIIGYSTVEIINTSNYKDLSFTITSLEGLKDLDKKLKKKINVHLKIDTGMNRQGILISEINEAFDLINKNKLINLEGICSHFSDSDNDDSSFTLKQIDIWNNLIKDIKNKYPNLKYWHLSNTYGQKYSNQIDENISRLGIGLYGLANIPGISLKPVLEMNTIVTGIKKINKGGVVGYNNTFKADRDMTIATIPVGYYEGLNRRLSDVGYVKIKGVFCKIVGRVSMNITTIDVSNINEIKIGDKVQVISPIASDKNSIQSISEPIGTIPYEAVIKIPERLRRIVVE